MTKPRSAAAATIASFLVMALIAGRAEAVGYPSLGCGDTHCPDVSFHAYVGVPFDSGGPLTNEVVCQSWNYRDAAVASGALPPGLALIRKGDGHHIVGTAERAGTWHLTVKFVGITCRTPGGQTFSDGERTQVLHITAEGSSAPRSVP